MKEQFDPYHRWLGIRPEEQPADHYRLLGLAPFEDDVEVIRDAAERQMGHVRRYALGQHRKVSQRILNELGAAKACLVDDAKRADYDRKLRQSLTTVEKPDSSALPPRVEPSPTSTVTPQPPIAVSKIGQPAVPSKKRSRVSTGRRRVAQPAWWRSPLGMGAAVAVGLVALILLWIVIPRNSAEPDGQTAGMNVNRPTQLPEPVSMTGPPLAVAPFDEAQARRHQEAWADHLGVDVETTNSIGMRLVLIPPGEFMMGSPESEEGHNSSEHQHRVRITKGFQLGVYEVTQWEYERVMGRNPSEFSSVSGQDTSRFPVEQVSWEDAVKFCGELSAAPEEERAGRVYRLPTEAEWEYACRAGTTSVFHFGDSLSSTQANFDGDYPYGGAAKGPDLQRPAQVGSYQPNAWGMYDMHGNVWEWCSDWYDKDAYKAFSDKTAVDPTGPPGDDTQVYRGGSWSSFGVSCRPAGRYWSAPGRRYIRLGFRVARGLSSE